MFKIEPTEQRDTFRLRSTQRPAILFEVSAITKDATKRLEAIQAMEELGSGFYLAMHDLEIGGTTSRRRKRPKKRSG